MAFGIAMSIRANIGVAPGGAISVAAYMFVPLTIGQCVALFHVFCIIMQAVLTRKLKLVHILQLPLAYIFGMMLDLFYVMFDLPLHSFWHSLFFLVLGMFIFSLGIRAVVGAKIILAPPDGLAMAMGDLFNWPMSKAKLVFDIISTTLAALLTFFIGGNAFMVVGVGTAICAIFTGPLIGLYTKLLPFLDTAKQQD